MSSINLFMLQKMISHNENNNVKVFFNFPNKNVKNWSEFWGSGDIEPVKYNKTGGTGYNVSPNGDFYVSNSYFESLTSDYGGAIRVNSNYLWKTLIESSLFISCSSSHYGGAIYIYSGSFIMNKVCGYKCKSSNSYGGFLDDGESNTLYIKLLDSAISSCIGHDAILYLRYGAHACKSINCTDNECNNYCPLYSTTSTEEGRFFMSFSTIFNNYGEHNCIYLSGGYYKCIENTNIIQNKIGDGCKCDVFGSLLKMILKHCAILENKAVYYIFSGTFDLYDCTIDSNQLSITDGSITQISTPITSFTNVLPSIDCANIYKETIYITKKKFYMNVDHMKKSKIYPLYI